MIFNYTNQKDAKYDPELEQQIRVWINVVIGEKQFDEPAHKGEFHETLKSGVILCRYVIKMNRKKIVVLLYLSYAFLFIEEALRLTLRTVWW